MDQQHYTKCKQTIIAHIRLNNKTERISWLERLHIKNGISPYVISRTLASDLERSIHMVCQQICLNMGKIVKLQSAFY